MEDIQNPTQIQPDDKTVQPVVQAGSKEAPRPVSEYLKPSESMPQIREELKGVVEVNSEDRQLDEQDRNVGIAYSPAAMPTQTEPKGTIQLMSDEEAKREMAKIKNEVAVDFGEHGEENAYIVPSRAFVAVLSDKLHKLANIFRVKERQTA